jgi:hypothetical protein
MSTRPRPRLPLLLSRRCWNPYPCACMLVLSVWSLPCPLREGPGAPWTNCVRARNGLRQRKNCMLFTWQIVPSGYFRRGGAAGAWTGDSDGPPGPLATFNCFLRLFTHPVNSITGITDHSTGRRCTSTGSNIKTMLTQEGRARGGSVHPDGTTLPNQIKPSHLRPAACSETTTDRAFMGYTRLHLNFLAGEFAFNIHNVEHVIKQDALHFVIRVGIRG